MLPIGYMLSPNPAKGWSCLTQTCELLCLGSPMCQVHTCICGVEVDSLGWHGVSCKNQVERHPRHAQVNDIIKRALQSADIQSRLEPPGLSRSDRKRPIEMTLSPYKEGKSFIWDFTCINTLAGAYLTETSVKPEAVAKKAEKSKLWKYQEIRKEYDMIPIAVETFGSWGPEWAQFIKNLEKKIENLTGEKRSMSYLFQSISIAVQRGNAASILGVVKSEKD